MAARLAKIITEDGSGDQPSAKATMPYACSVYRGHYRLRYFSHLLERLLQICSFGFHKADEVQPSFGEVAKNQSDISEVIIIDVDRMTPNRGL